MKPIRNLLVPVDFSHNSIIVLRHAIEIAQKAGAEITIFHAYFRPIVNRGKGKKLNFENEGIEEKALLKKLEKKIDYNFEMLFRSVPELKQVKTNFIKKRGTIVDLIVEVSEKYKTDMIIMGTRGARGLDEVWGTKAADVSLEVKIPVLIMPYESEITKHAKIAMAYDFERIKDISVMESIKLLAEVYLSEIHILNISDEDIKDEEKHLQGIRDYFKDIPHLFYLKKYIDVEEGIMEYIEQSEISMLVVLHRSRNFFVNLFRDNLTERIAFRSRVPILVLEV